MCIRDRVYVNTTSTDEIYDLFLARKNEFNIAEAEKLIDQMLTDVQKGEKNALIVAGGMKEAAAARKNCLMKKVYVHESKKLFVKNVKEDNEVEMVVILGSIEETRFGDFGGVVFEMFYRANLEDFMF
eukprot:TRINITY_DN9878_c0_g1_i2.p1 TRINITY_DN9878_c0_g1~~TRINITY_DN9878_c0_g1_i2.p1  ORF type:complete len:128 (+),score=55.51 TRINITY_DN9878_c0_g1_i2:99-482(+)